MSKSTIHAYEVTEVSDRMFEGDEIKPGVVIMYRGHVKSRDEPERIWQHLDCTSRVNDARFHVMRATHIGEWEKVKKYVGGWRDKNNLVPLVKDYAKWADDFLKLDGVTDEDYDRLFALRDRYEALFGEEANDA